MSSGLGDSVKILNQPVAPAFRESVRIGEQNLYTRAKELVGDRDPREHELFIQMRATDADRAVLAVLCDSLLGKNPRGGTIVVGALNLGASIDMISNAVQLPGSPSTKQAQTLLMPVAAARRQLNDPHDELWTCISIEFYKDAPGAVSRRGWSEHRRSVPIGSHVIFRFDQRIQIESVRAGFPIAQAVGTRSQEPEDHP